MGPEGADGFTYWANGFSDFSYYWDGTSLTTITDYGSGWNEITWNHLEVTTSLSGGTSVDPNTEVSAWYAGYQGTGHDGSSEGNARYHNAVDGVKDDEVQSYIKKHPKLKYCNLRSAARQLEEDESLDDIQRAAILKELIKRRKNGSCNKGNREQNPPSQQQEERTVAFFLGMWERRGTAKQNEKLHARRASDAILRQHARDLWFAARKKAIDAINKDPNLIREGETREEAIDRIAEDNFTKAIADDKRKSNNPTWIMMHTMAIGVVYGGKQLNTNGGVNNGSAGSLPLKFGKDGSIDGLTMVDQSYIDNEAWKHNWQNQLLGVLNEDGTVAIYFVDGGAFGQSVLHKIGILHSDMMVRNGDYQVPLSRVIQASQQFWAPGDWNSWMKDNHFSPVDYLRYTEEYLPGYINSFAEATGLASDLASQGVENTVTGAPAFKLLVAGATGVGVLVAKNGKHIVQWIKNGKVLQRAFNSKEEAQKFALFVLNKTCFAAGTPILTPTGSKPIEQLVPGDVVLSKPEWNPESPSRPQMVEEVFESEAVVWQVNVGGQTIKTTPEHNVYVKDRGWLRVHELKTNDVLVGHDGVETLVQGVEPTNHFVPVYNMRIAEDHTYYVGGRDWRFSVWVHNSYRARPGANGTWDLVDHSGDVIKSGLKEADAHRRATQFNDALKKVPHGFTSWQDYLSSFKEGDALGHKGPDPSWPNSHGHHIVPKGMKEAQEARDLLTQYGIDPYRDRLNLIFAPRKGHTKEYATMVNIRIKAAAAGGGNYDQIRKRIIRELREIGREFLIKHGGR